MDLETRLVDNTMVPYAIGIYDGIESFSFYLTDFYNPDKIMIMLLNIKTKMFLLKRLKI